MPNAISPNSRIFYIMSHGKFLRHVGCRSLKWVVRRIMMLDMNNNIPTQTPQACASSPQRGLEKCNVPAAPDATHCV